MKIEKRSENNKLTFKDLKVGDVFKGGCTKRVCMKIKECSVGKDCITDDFNAIMLATGDFFWFFDGEEVEPIPNATLIY